MEKLQRYYGILLFVVIVAFTFYGAYNFVVPLLEKEKSAKESLEKNRTILATKKQQIGVIEAKLRKLKDSVSTSTKKVYYPIESDLGDDGLFFALYNDLLEMVSANSVKIKSIDYVHNPAEDNFVTHGKGEYFVCNVNLELISSYTDLGKLIEQIYKYNYYIKINSLKTEPHARDKKILLTKLSLTLYSHTDIEQEENKNS